MPGPYSGRSAVIGFGKQASEGTALTTPKFEIPMGEGGLVSPERTDNDLPWTNDSQDQLGGYASLIASLVDSPLPVLPVSGVSLFELVLGTRTTTGAGPYSHEITPANQLPWSTWFYKVPSENYITAHDVKLGTVSLGWSAGNPLELNVSGRGKKKATRDAAKWGAAGMEEGVDPFYTYIGATMKFEAAATPAVTTVKNIGAGSISIGRNLQEIQTDDITHQYMAEGMREIDVTLDDVVMEDNALINTVFFGSPTGTTASSAIVYGSAEFTFLGSDQAAAATRSLKIAVPRVKWAIDRVPASSVGSDVLRYTVAGRAYKPTSGSVITATFINDNAGTLY